MLFYWKKCCYCICGMRVMIDILCMFSVSHTSAGVLWFCASSFASTEGVGFRVKIHRRFGNILWYHINVVAFNILGINTPC